LLANGSEVNASLSFAGTAVDGPLVDVRLAVRRTYRIQLAAAIARLFAPQVVHGERGKPVVLHALNRERDDGEHAEDHHGSEDSSKHGGSLLVEGETPMRRFARSCVSEVRQGIVKKRQPPHGTL
jgi:hypothetical protein